MTEFSIEDRRIHEINNIKERLIRMESTHDDLVRSKATHADIIDKLLEQDRQLTLALNSISAKFDSLIDKMSFGFKLISIVAIIIVTLIGGFWTYTKDMDNKYMTSGHYDSDKQLLLEMKKDIEEIKNK